MNEPNRRTVEVNGRRYAWPEQPLVVVCIDGSEPGYEGSDGGGYITGQNIRVDGGITRAV